MIPILYSSITEGTVPSDYGLGALSDCLACEVNEERNGAFELTLTYAAQGIHAEDIQVGRYIKAQPNFTDAAQLFQIYKVGKTINGRFEVNAQHVSYILSGKPISSGTANNIVTACSVLTAQAGNFTINTTKSTSGDFSINVPSSVRSWLGGKTGSLLDVYGGGEWVFNNFTCTLKANRGVVTPRTTIRYGKNLTELNQTIDASNLYTHVLCYYKPEDAAAISGNEVATGLTGTKRVLILDVTGDYQTAPDVTDLDNDASAYIATHNLTLPVNNFTLNFVQSGQLFDRVDLCDVVNVYFEALGISATVKCIRVKWDVLKERYIETEFGEPKATITDTIAGNSQAIAEANAVNNEVKNLLAEKKRVFTNTPVPPYDIGDLWTDEGAIYVCSTARASDYINMLGETSTAIEDGDTTNPITINGQSVTATTGDVATVVVHDGDETLYYNYVWNGSSWVNYKGYITTDWNLATNYVDTSDLEDSINKATQILTGGLGGNIVINYRDATVNGVLVKIPYEILILCDADNIDDATQYWRWNSGGLGYTHDAGLHFENAFTVDPITGVGQFNADMINTGTLNALDVQIINLNASMFTGQTIVLGGAEDCKLEVQDLSNPPKTLIKINGNGLECFGDPVGGVTPSVVFGKNGVTGYTDSTDKENTAFFWTHEDNFCMANATIKNEASIGGKIRFVPLNNGTNNGVAIVAAI